MKLTALDSIKLHEGFRSKSYYATAFEKEKGIYTIGYGDTQTVKTSITKEEASNDVKKRLNDLEDWIDKELIVRSDGRLTLSNGEKEAIKSLVDNVGKQGFKVNSKIRQRTKAYAALLRGDKETAMKEMFDTEIGFVRQGSKKLAGLQKRRQWELENLWLT